MSSNFHLQIIYGEPYKKNDILNIPEPNCLVGRPTQNKINDINFVDPRISKKHFCINISKNRSFIFDLGSKHGTQLNLSALEAHKEYPLAHNDEIIMSQGVMVAKFIISDYYFEETVDLSTISNLNKPSPFLIDIAKREISLDGNVLSISGKELELILLLYNNKNQALSYDSIKSHVWSERIVPSSDDLYDISNEEIIALVYRLRKRLGIYSKSIVSIPRYGYRLDWDY